MADDLQIDTTDFKGRRIICTKHQWRHHIVGSPHHEYMEGEEEAVILALKKPSFGMRFLDTDDPQTRCYYRMSATKDYYTKVIVKFENEDGDGDGFIVTAYMPDDVKPKEKPELQK